MSWSAAKQQQIITLTSQSVRDQDLSATQFFTQQIIQSNFYQNNYSEKANIIKGSNRKLRAQGLLVVLYSPEMNQRKPLA